MRQVGNKAPSAVAEALNRGATAMRPELSRAIRELYDVKATKLSSKLRVNMRKATRGELAAGIGFNPKTGTAERLFVSGRKAKGRQGQEPAQALRQCAARYRARDPRACLSGNDAERQGPDSGTEKPCRPALKDKGPLSHQHPGHGRESRRDGAGHKKRCNGGE